MGDGRPPGGGKHLLSRRSLQAMQSNPGPGGTLLAELEGMGITWMLRPTAEGERIVQHGGSWPGQSSGFMMVPEPRLRDHVADQLARRPGTHRRMKIASRVTTRSPERLSASPPWPFPRRYSSPIDAVFRQAL
jgi:hypothetical protein